MAKKKPTQSGFTIVELLIVVVIIAILATITIVAFNGIQTKAKNSSAVSAASIFAKKVHAYYSISGAYPTNTGTVVTTLATYSESNMGSANVIIGTPSTSNGTNTIKVELCTSGGVKVTPFDFTTGLASTTVTSTGNVSSSCSVATA